eukprot:gene6442-8863_t
MWSSSILYCVVFVLTTRCSAVQQINSIFKTTNSWLNKAAITSTLAFSLSWSYTPDLSNADARLNAPSAAGTRVNSDAESLLRNGLPFENKNIRTIQENIESAKMNLKTRRINFALTDVQKFKNGLSADKSKIIKDFPANHQQKAQEIITQIIDEIKPLEEAIGEELSAGSGSLQQRKGLDNAYAAQEVVSKDLSRLEELLVPDEFKREIPPEYSNLPALQKRAKVEMVIRRPDNSQYDVDGKLYDNVKVTLVIDGYNAPITGGNFIDLVQNGFYNGKSITRSDGFVVQTGDADPAGEVHGYVPKGSTEERKIPLEISIKGDPNLLYDITTEDDGRGYVATVLPFQSYGALGMARSEFEANSASSQFFWLLFESDLTPAGKNLLDGRYTCFGYTVDNADLLKGLKEGDVIVSAKVVEGQSNLILTK